MSYYVIGVGGTGAKCVEALTHLCAAGLMPQGDLYALFVDPDRSNGSLDRAEVTLQQYVGCKQLDLGGIDLFKTEIDIARPDVWSPFGDEVKPRLDNFFHLNDLKARQKPAANLFDVLYSSDEKSTGLEEGFRGHPSIGAAVMASTLQLGEGEPWKTFRNKIEQDIRAEEGAKIILIGSIFGGTGASGVPTIARLIRKELEKIGQKRARLGCVLMLPYFSFPPVDTEALRADSANFLLSTKAALKYYYQQSGLNTYDVSYLLGEQALSPVHSSSIGGPNQRNEPHFMELYAALACIEFFRNDSASGCQLTARHRSSHVSWSDLPFGNGSEEVRQSLARLTRFCFAYASTYYPALDNINSLGRGYRSPWYINFFERNKNIFLSRAMQTDLLRLKKYCESFLLWLANIQVSGQSEELSIDLANHLAFAQRVKIDGQDTIQLIPQDQFKLDEFSNLIRPASQGNANALNQLWEAMCEASVSDMNADGIGRFVHALYRECSTPYLTRTT